jgi:hypothetical protein
MRLFRSSYQNLLEIGKSRKGAMFLDVGSGSENHDIIIATRATSPKHLHLNSGNRRTQAHRRWISTRTSGHI